MSAILDEGGNVIGDDGAGEPVAVAPAEVNRYSAFVSKFQQALFDADSTAQALNALLINPPEGMTQADTDEITARLAEFDAKKSSLKFTAQSLNTLVDGVNFMGGSMSSLAIPSGLGFALPTIPMAVGGAMALGAMALLLNWVYAWITDSQSVLERFGSGVTNTVDSAASLAKWAAIGIAAYLVYQMYMRHR